MTHRYLYLLVGFLFIVPLHGQTLSDAIRSKDIEKIRSAIVADPESIKKCSGSGQPPLHEAIRTNDPGIVKLLLENHADPEMKDPGNLETALHMAASRNNKEMVELLLSQGADVNARSRDGSTPLHCAVSHYQKEIVQLLIEHHADVNAVENRGKWTPIHLTVVVRPSVINYRGSLEQAKADIEKSFKEIAEILVAHNADIHAKDSQGRSAFQLAQERKLPVMVAYFQSLEAK